MEFSSLYIFALFSGYRPVPPGPWCHASSACAHNRRLCSAWWGYLLGGDERCPEGESHQGRGSLHLLGWWHHLPPAAQREIRYWRPTGKCGKMWLLETIQPVSYLPAKPPFSPHRVMLAWRDVKLSSTLMEAGELTVVVPSLGRITQRLTALLLMLHAGWPSLWLRLSSAGECWSRWVAASKAAFPFLLRGGAARVSNWYNIYVSLGILCYWSCPSPLHFNLPLWDLQQERKRAAWHCEEELWSPSWSHCQVILLDETPPNSCLCCALSLN